MSAVSIPKGGGNPGTPQPKNPNIILIPVSAIETFPVLVSGDVVVTEEITLKEGASAIACYVTPSTIKISDSAEGDPDKRGFKHKFEAEHPGREDNFENFVEDGLNEDYVILAQDADPTQGYRLMGTPFNPMKMNTESLDDSESVSSKMTFESAMRSGHKIKRYMGKAPAIAPAVAPTPPTEPVTESL